MTMPDHRIDVGFASDRSISEWESRHRSGDVPGRWPYGLDQLSAFAEVRSIDLAPPTRVDRIRARIGLGPRPTSAAVGLTWDENAALRMALTKPHARHVTGVIWITDAAAHGRSLGRLPAALGRCAGLWVLSQAQVKALHEVVPSIPVEYVRFGIDEEFFTPRPYPLVPRVVSVGGDRDRDTATLFHALAKVHDVRPDVELVVQTASDRTAPEGVRTVRHLPHVQLRDLYASASVVAIATRPNLHVSGMTVSLEAMATARPVVETRTPGMDDYIAHGETGLLTGTGDPDALAMSILQLLSDPSRAAEMGTAGRRSVEARFTSTLMAQAIGDMAIRAE